MARPPVGAPGPRAPPPAVPRRPRPPPRHLPPMALQRAARAEAFPAAAPVARPPLRDDTFLTFPNGAVHLLSIPGDVTHLVSTGSDLLLMHGDDMLSLMNPSSSSATTPFPVLVAAFPKEISRSWKAIITIGQPLLVVNCKPHLPSFIVNIALFQGKLYCLTSDVRKRQEEHYIFGVDTEQIGIKCIRSTPRDKGEEPWFDPCSTEMYVIRQYLVMPDDRLLMVRQWINLPPIYPSDSGIVKRTRRFEVFEAADLRSGCARWIKVDTLMGHAHFVSKGCSKSLSERAEEDCIYFLHEDIKNGMPEDPFFDSGVYNMGDKMVAPLLPKTAAAEPLAAHGGPWCPTWLFPSKT